MDRERALNTPSARAQLPLATQLRLYFDPFALFRNASCGSDWAREQAHSYNRAMRWMLLVYLRRWTIVAAALYLCIVPLEVLGADRSQLAVPAAALGVAFCVAVSVIVYTLVAYAFLSKPHPRKEHSHASK